MTSTKQFGTRSPVVEAARFSRYDTDDAGALTEKSRTDSRSLELSRLGKERVVWTATHPKRTASVMKTIEVQIKGNSPYLMSRFNESAEQPKSTRKMLMKRGTPREEASKLLYQDSDGHFFFPGACVERMLRAVASNHKLRGSRKSAKYVLPSAVRVVEDAIIIRNGDGKSPASNWEVDSRPVVIQSTKGRIMRHRPRFDNWSVVFTIILNDELLEEDFIHQLMDEAGQQNGLGDFRVEKGGHFGMFQVVEWREQP